jgi:hypothetical protein
MPLSVTKQLMCPSCGLVVATAVLRRWPGSLVLTAVDGTALLPEGVGLQLERARARLAANPRDPAAVDRLAFLKDHLEELVFDLTCPAGHSILRTMPQIAQAVRRAPGPLVDLGR